MLLFEVNSQIIFFVLTEQSDANKKETNALPDEIFRTVFELENALPHEEVLRIRMERQQLAEKLLVYVGRISYTL